MLNLTLPPYQHFYIRLNNGAPREVKILLITRHKTNKFFNGIKYDYHIKLYDNDWFYCGLPCTRKLISKNLYFCQILIKGKQRDNYNDNEEVLYEANYFMQVKDINIDENPFVNLYVDLKSSL